MLDRFFLLVLLGLLSLITGCDSLFGSKENATTDEIFEEGRIDPGQFNEAEYVPFLPFFQRGGDGAPLEAPRDVYVGFDELVYVVDRRGLHVLDLAGRPALFVDQIEGQPLRNATSVIQDRRLHLYVTARRDTTVNGQTWDLPIVYHLAYRRDGTQLDDFRLVDIIWHPFDEDSRRFNRPDPMPTDEDVAFTGVAALPDNSIYVSRRGPVNSLTSVILPHNTILEFTPAGFNVRAITLSPTSPSLRSSVNPTDVMTLVHPPQRSSFPASQDFFVAQSPYDDEEQEEGERSDSLRYAVLGIRAVETPDGTEYRPNTSLLQATFNDEEASGFLYEEFKFNNPVDLAYAADETNYLYVLDAGKDSLFVFTASGIEGVQPPSGSRATTPVNVSFGGTGDGALQFRDPHGVTYFDEVVYVADTGNNRISRFKLNTDFE